MESWNNYQSSKRFIYMAVWCCIIRNFSFHFTNMNGSSQYIISFNLPEIIMCVLMGLLNIIVSIILPILIISKQNPRELLIDNK